MAVSFRPMSFHCSSTACVGLTGALGGSFFFAASCATAGSTANPTPSTRPATTFHFFISFLLRFAREPDVTPSDAQLCQAFLSISIAWPDGARLSGGSSYAVKSPRHTNSQPPHGKLVL